jgi:hypothetical protein
VVGSAAGVEVPHRSAMGHCQRRRGSGSMISGAPLERHGSQGAEGSWRRVPQPRFTWDATVWIGANNFHVAIGASSTWRRSRGHGDAPACWRGLGTAIPKSPR